MKQSGNSTSLLSAAVIVASLGYFVDIYDLLLFSIVRIPSLQSLGYTGGELKEVGLHLLDMQMFGMLIGGILWGMLGDKRGRLSVLFGSIFLYSVANIANGMVNTINGYSFWRFVAGVGLAGELGAGITLVSEVLPKEKRGIGTMIVATVGLTGAVVAGFIAKVFDWRTCYYIGGGLGLALLLLRIGVAESGMFHSAQKEDVQRGNFFALFTNGARFMRYLRCIFIGFPTWFVVGILVSFSPEFAKALNVTGEVVPGNAVMFCYGGLVLGDLATGLLSQMLKSRIKVMFIFLALSGLVVAAYLNAHGVSATVFYALIFVLGFSVGFWVIFVTIAAEQFGTNLRATVTTTVPNFARGSLVLVTFMFRFFEGKFAASNPDSAILYSAMTVGTITLVISLLFLYGMEETFSKDLDYVEK